MVFPIFGIHAAPAQHLAISAIFTGLRLRLPVADSGKDLGMQAQIRVARGLE